MGTFIQFFKKKRSIHIAIIALLAAFTLQIIGIRNVLNYTEIKISQDVDDLLVNGLFEELNKRTATTLPDGFELTLMGTDGEYSGMENFKFVNDTVSSVIHKDVDLDSLQSVMETSLKNNNLAYSFKLSKIENGKVIETRYSHKPFFSLLTVTSNIVHTKSDNSAGVQIELQNINEPFLQETGFLIAGSLLISLLLIWCIVKQLSIIRIQRKTMQMRKDFTYAMVHDMKTPLSTITLGANALGYEKVAGNAEMRSKYIRIMKDEAQHLFALVNKILTISKLEEGKLEMNRESVELVPMVESIEEKFSTHGAKEICFTNNIAAETVFADAEYLAEALSNLVDNAVKYSRKDVTTEIEVSSRDTGSGVEIRVRDNGIGISKKDQKVIFDKFERASASGRTFKNNGPAGFGLGLSYVMQVIEGHGGIVGVDSEVGQYTEFTLLLPYENDDSRK